MSETASPTDLRRIDCTNCGESNASCWEWTRWTRFVDPAVETLCSAAGLP